MQTANLFGKAKTLFIVITLAFVTVQHIYWKDITLDYSNNLLIVAIALAFFSSFFRMIPNYWYANILSLMNLLMGIFAMVLIYYGFPMFYGLACIFLGQIIDLFDGRAAQKWGSPAWGEKLDDIADGTTFGLAIGFIVFYSIENFWIACAISAIYCFCTFYRLIRFLRDKKEADINGGVDIFNGLPSPAGALFVGSVLTFTQNMYSIENFKIIFVLACSFLMISHIPYIHFGRSILPTIPATVKVSSLAILIALIAFAFQTQQFTIITILFLIAAVLYLFLGINFTVWKKQKFTIL